MTPAQRRRQADWQRRVAAHPVSRSHSEIGADFGTGMTLVAFGVLALVPLAFWGGAKLLGKSRR